MTKRIALLVAVVALCVSMVASVARAEHDDVGGVGVKSTRGGISIQEHDDVGGVGVRSLEHGPIKPW